MSCHRSSRCLSALLAGTAFAAGAAEPQIADPVHVFYEGAGCRGAEIELEVWDRDDRGWTQHPRHRRVPVRSCQVEDAGVLLNELRWRCVQTPSEHQAGWSVGLEVFDSEVMSRCAVDQIVPGSRETSISVSAPQEGVAVRAAEPRVPLEGSVRVGGLEGVDYDVVLAIDRSTPASRAGPDPLAAQVEAARAWLRALTPRLGAVRVGIVSYPNLPPRPGESTAARRELELTDDASALHAALARLRWQRAEGLSTTSAGLAEALDELTGPGARARARRVVLLLADGGPRGSFLGGLEEATLDDPHLALAERAAERGIRLHLFALGGLSQQPPARVHAMLARASGSFTRVLPRQLETAFLSASVLPVAEAVSIETEGGRAPAVLVRVDARGRFRAEVPVEPGENHLLLSARTSDGATARRSFQLVFDDSLILERILEAERERIRRAQYKHLELEGARPEAR